MAFTPFAGSDGRLSAVTVAPDLALPMPAALTTGTTAAIAGIRSWRITLRCRSGAIVHFESPAAASGPLWEQQIQGGIAGWEATVEGYWNNDTVPTSTLFFIGQILEADFIFSRGANFGRKSNSVKVMELGEGNAVDDEKHASFSARLAGHGALTAPA